MRGRRNGDKPQGNDSLPPCRVCGEPGSGFHYGVTTCGACKGFFRRSLVRKESYVCVQSHLCFVGPSTSRRESCPKCRYDKCVALGMSKDACKVGRYSLLKKHKDMKEAMEHKTALGKSDAGSNISVTEVLRSNEMENETLCLTSGFESTRNEFYSPHIVPLALSKNESMRWNLGGQENESQHDCGNSTSSEHDSNDSFYRNEDKNIDDNYDETLSISSCFLKGVNCEDKLLLSSGEMDSDTLALDAFESRDNCAPEPCYTVLKASTQIDTVPSLVDVDTPKTEYLDYHPYYSTAFSHTDISLTPLTHNSNVHARCSLNYSDDDLSHCWQMKETKPGYDVSCPDTQKYTINQQSSSLTSQHSRHDNHYSTSHTYNDRNITQMPDQHNQWHINHCIAQSFNSEDLIQHDDEHSKIDVVNPPTNKMDVSVESSRELSVFHPRSVIQSIGHPIINVFPHLRRSFDEDLNFDDINLQMSLTKESRDNHVPIVISTENLKRKYENQDDNDGNLKKRCKIKRPQRQSIIKFQPEEGDSSSSDSGDSSTSESGDALSPKPTFLLYFNPNMSNYVLSVFERFPFVSYEKRSLGSLLNHCYEINDSLSECMSISRSPSKTNTENSLISNSFLSTVLAKASSKGMHSHTLALSYDENKMDDLFSSLMDTHKRLIKNELSFMTESEIQSAQDIFWALCQFKEMVHGKMKFIEDEKYFTILETTGIDVDNRKEYMLTYINPMEDYLSKIIRFFRAIPGFGDFTLADKITLIKSSLPIYLLLSNHRGFDTTRLISIDEETGTATRLTNIQELFPKYKEFFVETTEIVDALKSLRLSVEEIVVLKALALTYRADDDWLKQPDNVRRCHIQYCQCLLNLERKRHSSQADDRFSKMVGIVYNGINVTREMKITFHKDASEQLIRLLDKGTAQLFKEVYLDYSVKEMKSIAV